MKKIFLLIPALILSMMMSATKTPIDNSSADALRLALYNSTAGDTIVMEAGVYEESNSDYIAWRRSNVVMAKEGANVIIKPHVSFRVRNGARAELIGVKIDASELTSLSGYEDIFQAGDANDGNRLILEGCEIYGNVSKTMLRCASDKKLDSLIINNCYIHDNAQATLRLQSTSLKGVIITNTTIANVANGGSFWCAPIDISSTAENAKVIVDHCTFYHNTSISSSYADVTVGVDGSATSDVTISNCIFAQPEPYAGSRAINLTNGGTVRNCITFNYTRSTNGIQGATVKENCVAADPRFTDAEHANYTFPCNWVAMNLSPACAAATDGSDLGDPRWYSEQTLPSADLTTSYALTGNKAILAGNIWYDGENEYLYGDGGSNKEYGTARWKLHAETAGVISVAANLNSGNTSGHKLRVNVFDAAGNGFEYAEQASTLPGSLIIPEAGDYVVVLHEDQTWSSAKIDNVSLAYVGGAVQSMPGTTNINDAWFSSNGTRTAGEYIAIPAGHQDEGWVKWNVSFAETANYNVTVNINNENGHNYTVALYTSESDESPITIGEGAQKSTVGTLELGAMEVPAGNYIMKVTNATQWSDAKLVSVKFEYAGGAAVDLSKTTPANLLANADAIVSDDWSIEGGKIVHPESKALTGWAKWNVNSADYGNYNVTVNISSDNGHLVRVEIFEDETAAPIYTLDETSATQYHTGDQAIDLGNIVLDNREYVVKVSNTGEYSHVQIASIVISYLNGARATLPASCTFADLMLSPKAQIYDNMLYFEEPGDHNPVGQWAKWNVKVAEAGTFLFTMNVSSTNGQSYKISILDMNEDELDAFESGSLGSGDKVAKGYFNLAAGNYIVMLENTTGWSQGHVVSLAVTVATDVFVLDESTEDDGSIAAAAETGEQYTFLLKRSFTAGKYYTICLPVSSWNSELKLAFGDDYELWQMSSATQTGDEIDLNFEQTTSFSAGKPYIIKPSVDVKNPIFYNKKEIKNYTYNNVQEFTAADFVGTFYKDVIPAGESNLYLQNNNLYYSETNNTQIKGTRAWIRLKSQSGAAPKARIVLRDNTATAIDLVNSENKAIKRIENGQVVIIRDGIRYNVMGTKIQ